MLAMSLDNHGGINRTEKTPQREMYLTRLLKRKCRWCCVDGEGGDFFCAAVRGRCNGARDLQSTALKAHQGKINFTP